jgi:hypothetical protein
MSRINSRHPNEDEKGARPRNGVAGKVAKRAGRTALRGAGWTARRAGRAAFAGGKAAVSAGRRAGQRTER